MKFLTTLFSSLLLSLALAGDLPVAKFKLDILQFKTVNKPFIPRVAAP